MADLPAHQAAVLHRALTDRQGTIADQLAIVHREAQERRAHRAAHTAWRTNGQPRRPYHRKTKETTE